MNNLNIKILEFENKNSLKKSFLSILPELEKVLSCKFEIKRFYSLIDMSAGEVRGAHSHKETNQLIFPIQGDIEISVSVGDRIFETHLLKSNIHCLFIPKNTYKYIRAIKRKTIVGILTDKKFDENDYVRNYEEFLNYNAE